MKNYWHILTHHERPVRFLTARLLMAAGLCRLFLIKQKGYRLRFHNANLSSQLWINPSGRDEALAFFRDYLKDGDRVIDVGANIGDTVLSASVQVGSNGQVIGIEAHPHTFEFLKDNVRLNGSTNVKLIKSAVGASSGTVRFSDDRRDDMNRIDGGDLEVGIERLDALVPDALPLALLKVDVEGYEKFVFEGAAQVLRWTQCVFFEVSSLHFARYRYTTRDVLSLLLEAGFHIYRISAPARLEAISQDFDTDFDNLVALRDETNFTERTGWSIAG